MENEIFPMTVSLFLATIRRTPQVHNTTVPTMGEQNDVSSKREVGLETSPKAKRRLVFDDEKKKRKTRRCRWTTSCSRNDWTKQTKRLSRKNASAGELIFSREIGTKTINNDAKNALGTFTLPL
jgi:hypothetical protein